MAREHVKIAMDNNYHSYVGVEYEGPRTPAFEGIRKTKTLLEKIRAELSANA